MRLIIFVCILAMPCSLMVPSAVAAFKYMHIGMQIPDVSGEDLVSGDKVTMTLDADKEGVVVVVFWASWSRRSLEQLAALKEISEEFGDSQLQIIAVNVENENISKSKRQEIGELIKEMQIPYPVIIDDNLELFYTFGVIAVPSTAIVDHTGLLRFAPAGFSLTTRDAILDSIEVLLGLKQEPDLAALQRGYVPDNKAMRYYNLAVNLSRQGLHSRALEHLTIAHEADSGFPAPYSLRGEIFLAIDSAEKAVEQFSAAIALDSSFIAARSGLGRALRLSAQIDLACATLEAVLLLDDAYTPAVIDLSLCYRQQNRLEEALALLESALELNPKDPFVLYSLGLIHRDQGNAATALDLYIRAFELTHPSD